MNLIECAQQPIWPGCLIAAYYLQMGLHEGAHAAAAYRLGDDTASLLGKRSANPLAHIDFRDMRSVIGTIVLPFASVFLLRSFVPMGWAWVPISPWRFRKPQRDMALVSLAGPAGNLLICLVALTVHVVILRPLGAEGTSRGLAGVEALFGAIYLVSAVYGIFNLIPIPPLDGSRVLYWLGPRRLGQWLDQIAPFGFLIVLILIQVVRPVGELFWACINAVAGLYS